MKITSHFEGRYLSLREVEDWEFATRPNATSVVGILAMTAKREVVLIEQYRRPTQSRVLEICAGLVGDEPEYAGEPLAETARRELLEETGYVSEEMILLLSSPTSAGMTDEMTHLFFAGNATKSGPGGGVDGEDIVTHLVPFDELADFLEQALAKGLLVDFKIHAALAALNFLDSSEISV